MSFVFSASRLMKASEVVKHCREVKRNPALILMANTQAKEAIEKIKKQQAPTLTA
ncbi:MULTISPECIES: hypothetical protein [Bacillus]|uniref:hypothetical protein n=1 Tax=Bacillus TaxID=1386 RepID=UPI0014042F0E|nr:MULTISPECIES: hypothetical protein [Bacillus subtilis group]MBV7321679.1 hypothetical protein [Halalkalibacterium halodurans]MBT2169654.1 hypothetical protein [Bacillus subtilis]MCY8513508.1 hypothetical protein [Bacillus atrophaeus]MCY8992612.1 hypothetical protein [Bacillus atrophaeus]MCY9097400.1 hypothetical protein [Bacillus inaquosorum]